MDAGFRAQEAERFLSRLAPPVGQVLEVRSIVPDGPAPRQRFCGSVDDALRVIARDNGRANVYVGACPRFRRGGKKTDVNSAIAFWVDVDFHQVDSNRDAARILILDRLRAFGRSPSMVVFTGNGIQAWWLLSAPLVLGDEWSLERVESVNRGLAERLGGDAVQDLARVLRVPGTVNLPTARKRERGCFAITARLVRDEGVTYHPQQFSEFEVSAPQEGRSPSLRPMGVQRRDALVGSEVSAAFEALLGRLGPHHRLVQTWEGRRALADGSRSAFDMALACQMAHVGIREDLAALILRRNPAGKGAEAADSYIERTIGRAYARVGAARGR